MDLGKGALLEVEGRELDLHFQEARVAPEVRFPPPLLWIIL